MRECDGSLERPTTRGCGSAARRFSPRHAVRQAAGPPSEALRPSRSPRLPRISCSSRSRVAVVRTRARCSRPVGRACRRAARFRPVTRPPRSRSRPGSAACCPVEAIPIRALASLVAYSRVHTGVHYPADVLAGAFARHHAGAARLQGLRPELTSLGVDSRFRVGDEQVDVVLRLLGPARGRHRERPEPAHEADGRSARPVQLRPRCLPGGADREAGCDRLDLRLPARDIGAKAVRVLVGLLLRPALAAGQEQGQ